MSNKGGRPSYKPTPEDRNLVNIMAAAGVAQSTIARCIGGKKGITENTLRKYYAEELATASELANATVARKAFDMATKSDNPAWAIFWLKCRAGWKEKQEFIHTGPGGGPVELNVSATELLESRIARIAARADGADKTPQ